MSLFNVKNFTWNSLKNMASLNFAIFILFLLIFFSLLGSVIEQDKSISFYQSHYPIYSQYFIFLGLNHIYQTWWFILTIMFFVMSLILCTFSVQLPSLQNSRRWKFFNYKIENIENVNISSYYLNKKNFYKNSLINILYGLINRKYYIFHKSYYLYGYKGLLGRIAPIFVHFSIIVTLFGSLFSISNGFMSQENISKGEIFHIKNFISSGPLSSMSRNILGRIDDFFIEYNEDNSIKQFFSQISLLDSFGNILIKKKISVNSPLNFNGLTIYQTSWNIDAIRVSINSNYNVQKQLLKVILNKKTCWVCNLNISSNENFLIIVLNLQDDIYIYNIKEDKFIALSLNKDIRLSNISLLIKDIMVSTGLQIKIDPGIYIIYLGFFIIILSTSVSYMSYTQIWVNISMNNLKLFGTTNRAILFFEEDIIKINQMYKKYTF